MEYLKVPFYELSPSFNPIPAKRVKNSLSNPKKGQKDGKDVHKEDKTRSDEGPAKFPDQRHPQDPKWHQKGQYHSANGHDRPDRLARPPAAPVRDPGHHK